MYRTFQDVPERYVNDVAGTVSKPGAHSNGNDALLTSVRNYTNAETAF